jgi:hypothetical protein
VAESLSQDVYSIFYPAWYWHPHGASVVGAMLYPVRTGNCLWSGLEFGDPVLFFVPMGSIAGKERQ